MTGIEPATTGATVEKSESDGVGSCRVFAVLLSKVVQFIRWRWSLSGGFVRNVSSFFQGVVETMAGCPILPLLLVSVKNARFARLAS